MGFANASLVLAMTVSISGMISPSFGQDRPLADYDEAWSYRDCVETESPLIAEQEGSPRDLAAAVIAICRHNRDALDAALRVENSGALVNSIMKNLNEMLEEGAMGDIASARKSRSPNTPL